MISNHLSRQVATLHRDEGGRMAIAMDSGPSGDFHAVHRAVMTERTPMVDSTAGQPRRPSLRRGEKGQTALEFVLVLPVFFLAFLMVVELGFMMYHYVSLSNGVREGALRCLCYAAWRIAHRWRRRRARCQARGHRDRR